MKQEQTRYWLSFGGILLGILIISIAWMVSLAVTKRWIKERTLIEEERERFQQQFIQSEKMSAIGQLAGGVAHEINNPLGVILGFAQSIANKIKEGDPLTLPIQSMEREAKRCKKLVQDLLTFSRVGKTEKELCDLNEVLQSALSLVETQTKVNSVELLKDFGDDIGKIMVNRNQIQQVLINLCNNAIDAMPKGGTLTISTKVLSRQSPPEARISPRFGEAGAKGGLVTSQKLNGPGQGPGSKDSPRREAGQGQKNIQIVVSDTGDGMPKEIQSKIFEPFFTTKPVGKGTGLGLSLVYEIIQKHEGTIEVESEAGRGTSFIIMLPITK